MAQVLRNLLSNAIKFTPIEGKVEVAARVEEGILIVDVKDSGVGLTPSNREMLFNKVVQFNARAVQGGGGSGMGLVISKKIMDMHGGSITCTSVGPGHGSTFTIKIWVEDGTGIVLHGDEAHLRQDQLEVPVRPQRANSRGNLGSVQPSTYRGSVHFSLLQSPQIIPVEALGSQAILEANELEEVAGLRILIVDDSALNRKVMRRRLESDGYTCIEADDGDTALAFMERTLCAAVDVITMDNVCHY